jgi:hypothetical protein
MFFKVTTHKEFLDNLKAGINFTGPSGTYNMKAASDKVGWAPRTTSLTYDVFNVKQDGVLERVQHGLEDDKKLDISKIYWPGSQLLVPGQDVSVEDFQKLSEILGFIFEHLFFFGP